MTAFSLTQDTNIDALTSKAGGDTYNTNGFILTIDQDTRVGLNQATNSSMGAITINATKGGQVNIDGRDVKLFAYTSGSGNVPDWNTIISNGTGSGKLIGIYEDLTQASTATSGSMPSSGYIKLKQCTGIFSSGSFTGITATSSGSGVVGWLEIVGDDAGTVNANRLGEFNIKGAWYELGTTNGSANQQFQVPSMGLLQYVSGVFIQKALPVASTYTWSGSIVTVTSPSHGYLVDESVDIAFTSGSGTPSSEYRILSVPTPNTFTFALAGEGTSGSCTVSMFEFYPNAGTATDVGTEPYRGKVCWIDNTGLVRLGHNGTNARGYVPTSGLRVVIGNVFLRCAATADRTINKIPHATIASRYDITATGGGVCSIDKCDSNWYLSFSQAFSVSVSNTGAVDGMILSENASNIYWSKVGIGNKPDVNLLMAGLAISLCFAGGTFANCSFNRVVANANNSYILTLADCENFNFVRCDVKLTTNRGTASVHTIYAARANYCTFTNCFLQGADAYIVTCNTITMTDTVYVDLAYGTTILTYASYIFYLASNSINCKFDGLTLPLALTQPVTAIMTFAAAGCKNIKLRNLGTYANPLDLGAARIDDATWARVTTTATLTSTNHGLKAGDKFYVVQSSNAAAITIASKTVLTAPTADTLTFTCVSSGTTSGTLSYFPTVTQNLVTFAAGAAVNDVKIQRCYCPHTTTNLMSIDNSCKNVALENVVSDYLNAFRTASINLTVKGVSGTPPLTAETATYGTHWIDAYAADITPTLNSLSWSRTTTVCTVTCSNHKLRTGLLINVNASSDKSAVPLGIKSITVINSSTFTFTCVNTGASSGTIDIRTVIDRICVMMNEPTADTASQVTDKLGTTNFTSAGGLYMPSVDDSITISMAEYKIGYTGFPIQEAVMVGGTISNYNLWYDIDLGSGFRGSWKNLYYTRTSTGGVNGEYTFTLDDATGVEVGDYVWGTNIGGNAKVTEINGTTISTDEPNVGTVSGVIRFNHLRSETTIVPSTGFKLKIKITTIIANTTAITSLAIYGDSTEESRALQYPLDRITLSVTGLQVGSDVVIYQASGSNVRDSVDSNLTSSWDYVYSTVENIDIGVFKAGYVPFYIRNYSLTTSNASLPVAQVVDRAYLT